MADLVVDRIVQEQGRNIRHYSQYLHERARAYGDVRADYVRSGEGRLRKLSIEKGLLREVECVQQQIRSLLRCSVGLLAGSFLVRFALTVCGSSLIVR